MEEGFGVEEQIREQVGSNKGGHLFFFMERIGPGADLPVGETSYPGRRGWEGRV